MHSVILAVDVPPDVENPLTQRNWPILLEHLDRITNSVQGILRLSDTVVQIPLENGLPAFVECAQECKNLGCSYKVLFFQENPAWITS